MIKIFWHSGFVIALLIGVLIIPLVAYSEESAVNDPAKECGQPCRNFQFLDGTLIRDPNDGRQKLALNNFVAGGNGALIILDYQQDEAQRYDFPVHAGGRTILQISPARLIVASEYAGAFLPFDLAKCQWDTAKIGVGPGNDYTWMLSEGSDGWIYSGGYPHPNLYRYNPQSGEAQDLGEMFGEDNLYNRFVAALPNGWVLSSVGFNKFALVAFYPPTGEKKLVPNQPDAMVQLNAIGNKIFAAWGGKLHCIDGDSFEEILPLPIPTHPKPDCYWSAIYNQSDENMLYLLDSQGVLYRVNPNSKQVDSIWHLNLRGGRIMGIDDRDRVVGIRGQDYFVAPLNAESIALKRIPVDAPATAIHFLSADPKGGIVGGPGFGQTLFHFDPKRKINFNTAQVVDAGGEVFDGKFFKDKFYFAAYSHADVAVWDPEADWNQWEQINPRTLHSFYSEGVCRPRGGMIQGPKHKFYIGFSAHYGQTGGAIAEYDPISGKTNLWMNPIPDHSITALASDGKLVFAGASVDAEGIKPVANDAYFFVFNPETEKIIVKHRFPAMPRINSIAYAPAYKKILVADTSAITIFDGDAFEKINELPLDGSYRDRGPGSFFSVENELFFAVGRAILFIDPASSNLHQVYEAPALIQHAVYSEPMVYFTHESRLFRLESKYIMQQIKRVRRD